MQVRMTVLQAMAVAKRDAADEKTPTHIQLALQSDDGDNQLSLTVPLDRAAQFMIGSTIVMTLGGTH